MQLKQKALSTSVVGWLALVCFLGSMMPFLGVLFTIPLHDLIILFVSLLIVQRFKLIAPFKFFALVVTWVVISIGIEITRIDLYVRGVRGITAPYSVVSQKMVADRKAIALHGDVNTILYAAGQRGFVSTDINVAGMRSIKGVPLINRAGRVDITDAIFGHGWIPRIGELSYPRITVKRVQKNGMELLAVVAQQNESGNISRVERAYPVPAPLPGAVNAVRDLLMPIFHDNFLRVSFGLNNEIRLSTELSDFLVSILGPRISDEENFLFTEFSKVVTSEVELNKDEIGRGVKSVVIEQSSLWHNSENSTFASKCPFIPVGREFGANETSARASIVETLSANNFPIVLGEINPDYVAFSYFCDAKYKDLIAFRRYGNHLKIARHSGTGKLMSTAYLRRPMRFEHPTQIVEASVVRDKNEVLSFAVAMPIVTVHSPHQVLVKDKFQRVDFTISQLDEKTK